MRKVFLYDGKMDFGIGQFASVNGYNLMTFNGRNDFEAVAATGQNERIYGYVYDLDDDLIDWLDTYYAIGLGMHWKNTVVATTTGGIQVEAIIYEYQNAKVV